jgi:predicted ATPase
MRTRLIGRDDALATLEASLARAGGSQPSAVVVEGEAGIGKTALLQHLVGAASGRGMRVLAGACLPGSGRDVPFLAWRGALRALDEESDLDSAGSPVSRGQVLAAVTAQLLAMARRRGTLVALEDVHWADDSTLELLDYVVRSASEERLLVAVTVRSADPAFERVRERLAELGRLPQVTVIRPRRLSPGEVARHVEALTGAPPGRGCGRAGGEPFGRGAVLLRGARRRRRW